MAVVTWSPELRIEVKKFKLFSSIDSASHTNCTSLSASEQKAMNDVFLSQPKESKEPKYEFWM